MGWVAFAEINRFHMDGCRGRTGDSDLVFSFSLPRCPFRHFDPVCTNEHGVVVQREMERPWSGDKVYCALKRVVSICRLGANPEGERQGGIVPPPFGLGPWDGARVVSPWSPILRPGHSSSKDRRSGRADWPREPLASDRGRLRVCGLAPRRSSRRDWPVYPRMPRSQSYLEGGPRCSGPRTPQRAAARPPGSTVP